MRLWPVVVFFPDGSFVGGFAVGRGGGEVVFYVGDGGGAAVGFVGEGEDVV